MVRKVVAVLATGSLLALAVTRSRRAGRLPRQQAGTFANGMSYIRWGDGPRSLLWIPGGPGNALPTGGLGLTFQASELRPFVERGYTAWLVTRRQGMPTGHTIADMADDYAELIITELGGRVDLVVGISFGGLIGYHLAACHPDRFGDIAVAVAGYAVSERGRALDREYATLLSQGRTSEAGAVLFASLGPGVRIPGLARAAGAMMGRLFLSASHPDFASDVLVEAEAEIACDARDVLPRIQVPLLLVCGDRDVFFPKATYGETAGLIPDCAFVLYEGKGHAGVVMDRRFDRDVLAFVGRRAAADARAGEVPVEAGSSV